MCIFLQRWFNDARNRVAKHFVFRQQQNHSMLNLLNHVGNTVCFVDLPTQSGEIRI